MANGAVISEEHDRVLRGLPATTGKSLAHWFRKLDEAGMDRRGFLAALDFLRDSLGVPHNQATAVAWSFFNPSMVPEDLLAAARAASGVVAEHTEDPRRAGAEVAAPAARPKAAPAARPPARKPAAARGGSKRAAKAPAKARPARPASAARAAKPRTATRSAKAAAARRPVRRRTRPPVRSRSRRRGAAPRRGRRR